jgi:hypothetical protein
LYRLGTLARILDLRCPLPADCEVVATDLKMKTAKVTNDLERENPGYVDYKTRAFGNTRYHLFGRTYDDITAICRIAKLYRFDTDRRVVAELAKSAGDVELAFGSASKIVMQGSNFNAKVSRSALLLPTQRAHVGPCFSPYPPPAPPPRNNCVICGRGTCNSVDICLGK